MIQTDHSKVNTQSVITAMAELQTQMDELGGLKEVTLGLADGDNVEVLSGLDSGDMVYYRYADTLTYTFIND